MHDPMGMTIGSSLKNLIGEFLNCFWWKWSTNLSHILLQVILAVLKNQIKVILLIDDFFELNDVGVLNTF